MANSVFSATRYQTAQSRMKRDRVELMSKDVAKELNTYKNFGIFPTFNDLYSKKWKRNKGTPDNPSDGAYEDDSEGPR